MPDDESLLYIEPDNEITEVIDRVRQAEADQIRVVIPKGAVVLQSLMSLKLLKREAAASGKELAVVISDPVGQHLAEQAELTTFARPKDQEPIHEFATVTRTQTRLSARQGTVNRRIVDDQEDDNAPGAGDGVPREDLKVSATDSSSAPMAEPEEPAPDGIAVHRYDRAASAPVADPARARTEALVRTAARRAQRGGPGSPAVRWLQRLVLVGGLFAAGYLVFMEVVPRSTLGITLATEVFEQAVTVTAQTERTAMDAANAIIPGTLLTASVQTKEEAPATGTKQIGEKATATVTLANYWDANPQAFPVGTVLLTSDSTRFVTNLAATIPGASTTLREGKVVTTPGTVNVTISAETAGTAANAKTGRLTIPSLPTVRQDRIYGEFVNPSAGGTSKEVTVVTQADLDTLTKSGQAALVEAAKAEITNQATPHHLRVLDGAVSLADTKETLSAAVGDEAETINFSTTATASAIAFTDGDLKAAAVAILEQVTPSGKKLIITDSDQLVASTKSVDSAAGTVAIEALIKTRVALDIDPESLADTAAGLTPEAADAALHEIAGVQSVTIELRPRWIKQLPRRSSQLSVSLTYATTDQQSSPSPSGNGE